MSDRFEKFEFWVRQQDLPTEVRHLYPDGALVVMNGANVVEMLHITEKKAKHGIEIRRLLKISYDEYRERQEKSNPRKKFYFSKIENEKNQQCRFIIPELGRPEPRWYFARLDSGEIVQYTHSVDLEDENPPDRYPDYVFVGIGRFDHFE